LKKSLAVILVLGLRDEYKGEARKQQASATAIPKLRINSNKLFISVSHVASTTRAVGKVYALPTKQFKICPQSTHFTLIQFGKNQSARVV
jgi:hypothetical protein